MSDAPAQVRRLIEKCLEKDPKKRLRDISGVALLLEAPSIPSPTAGQARAGSNHWILAGAALAGAAALALIHFRESQPEAQAVKFSLDAPSDLNFTDLYGGFAVSPDGRYIRRAGKAYRLCGSGRSIP